MATHLRLGEVLISLLLIEEVRVHALALEHRQCDLAHVTVELIGQPK